MDMFSLLRSKKTSEAGIWINDEEVVTCPLCRSTFNLLIRKHHCRKCGQVVCGRCSENRIFLESSRSGALKRVCDPCYARDRQPVPDDDEEEEENVRRAMAKASVGSSASASSSSSTGARAGPAGGSASSSSGGSASKSAPGGGVSSSSSGDIPAEAVEALKGVSWSGKWRFAMVFSAVDMGKAGPAGMTPEAASSFKGTPGGVGGAGAGGAGGAKAAGPVRVGSKVVITVSMKPKGAAYFQGECPEFAQFGKEGKVTGALQRGTGKVSMTISIVHPVTKVTTSFNCVGYCNGKGEYVGNFTGCEISKSAGTCAGVFTGLQVEAEGGGAEEGGGAPGEAAGSSKKKGGGSDDEEDKGKKKGGSKAKAKAKRKGSSSSDDSD